MRVVCVCDGYSARVYENIFWTDDPADVAAEYAEYLDDEGGEGPSERVVFVRDLDDPDGKIIAVSVGYELEPHYSGTETDEEPSDDVVAELNSVDAVASGSGR